MSRKYRFLCVGGEADGIWLSSDMPFAKFHARLKPPFLTSGVAEELTIKATNYVIASFLSNERGRDEKVRVWKPEGQSDIETMALLVQGYTRVVELP